MNYARYLTLERRHLCPPIVTLALQIVLPWMKRRRRTSLQIKPNSTLALFLSLPLLKTSVPTIHIFTEIVAIKPVETRLVEIVVYLARWIWRSCHGTFCLVRAPKHAIDLHRVVTMCTLRPGAKEGSRSLYLTVSATQGGDITLENLDSSGVSDSTSCDAMS